MSPDYRVSILGFSLKKSQILFTNCNSIFTEDELASLLIKLMQSKQDLVVAVQIVLSGKSLIISDCLTRDDIPESLSGKNLIFLYCYKADNTNFLNFEQTSTAYFSQN